MKTIFTLIILAFSVCSFGQSKKLTASIVSRKTDLKVKTTPGFHVTGIYEVDSILQAMPDSEVSKIKDLASKFCLDREHESPDKERESREYFIRRDAFISGFVFGKLITKK